MDGGARASVEAGAGKAAGAVGGTQRDAVLLEGSLGSVLSGPSPGAVVVPGALHARRETPLCSEGGLRQLGLLVSRRPS